MAEAQSFQLLKTKRKALRTVVTKVVNELEAELANSDLNFDRLSELVETLRIKFEPLTLVDQQMEPLFKPEEFDGIKNSSEKKSKLELQDLALKHFENTILRDDEGRYIVSIPWIEGNEKLEDHYSLVKGRLEKTVKTVKFTGRLSDYEQVFVDWEKEGIIEKVAQD
ncbi:uncharacterized protein TNCV_903291 [Trichonephila clavipes]|nr:uncharacterized protein TNCV_903291 [Trichonephila clavipes]